MGPRTGIKLSHVATGRPRHHVPLLPSLPKGCLLEPGRTLTSSARHFSHSTCLLQPSRRWSNDQPIQSVGHPSENTTINEDAAASGASRRTLASGLQQESTQLSQQEMTVPIQKSFRLIIMHSAVQRSVVRNHFEASRNLRCRCLRRTALAWTDNRLEQETKGR